MGSDEWLRPPGWDGDRLRAENERLRADVSELRAEAERLREESKRRLRQRECARDGVEYLGARVRSLESAARALLEALEVHRDGGVAPVYPLADTLRQLLTEGGDRE